jgi:hypothetical protein
MSDELCSLFLTFLGAIPAVGSIFFAPQFGTTCAENEAKKDAASIGAMAFVISTIYRPRTQNFVQKHNI